MPDGLAHRQQALRNINIAWLRQAIALVSRLDDDQFMRSPDGWQPHRVSGHLRHVIEFYECFLDGVKSSHVDYDARRRDEMLERSRAAAIGRLRQLIERLETDQMLRGDALLWVRMEDAEAAECADPWTTSSVSRELQALGSHTIHHFALIAVTLRLHGVAVDPDFGVAPSTLRHRLGKKAAA
jgi:uncharacterized damage-inducible protein DinB